MKNHFRILLLFIPALSITSCGDSCDDIECLNNGICIDGSCECPEGFEGAHCEIELSQVKRLLKQREISNGRVDEYFYNDLGVLIDHNYTYGDSSYNYTTNGGLDYRQNTFFTFDLPCGVTGRRRVIDGVEDTSTYEHNIGSCDHKATNIDDYGLAYNCVEYEFDNKRQPLPNPWFDFLGIVERNNTRTTYYDLVKDSEMTSPIISSAEIAYNKYDYPDFEIRTPLYGNVEEYTYTYYE